MSYPSQPPPYSYQPQQGYYGNSYPQAYHTTYMYYPSQTGGVTVVPTGHQAGASSVRYVNQPGAYPATVVTSYGQPNQTIYVHEQQQRSNTDNTGCLLACCAALMCCCLLNN